MTLAQLLENQIALYKCDSEVLVWHTTREEAAMWKRDRREPRETIIHTLNTQDQTMWEIVGHVCKIAWKKRVFCKCGLEDLAWHTIENEAETS